MSDAPMSEKDGEAAVQTLNQILELELAGLVRYLHYSFMIFGHNRIPIVAWLRAQANESQDHATLAGEQITILAAIRRSRSDRFSRPTSTMLMRY